MNDLISRQDAIDALREMPCKSDEDGYVWIVRSDAWAKIDNLPSARKMGEWIEHTNYVECNKCHSLFTFNGNYCSNCGARMEVDE